MTASLAPGTAPPRRGKTSSFWWCLLGICAEAVFFLLSTFSDACELPPPFEAMEPASPPKSYYEVGEKLEYKCKRGYLYLLPFIMTATCESNHTWMPISDEGCIRIQCDMLEKPLHGSINYIDGRFSWGARVTFSCIEGYYLIGQSVLHCVLQGEDAYWSGTRHAVKIYCSPPPKIKNGSHSFTDIDVFKYREAVTYSCNPKPGPDQFSLVGKSVLFCSGYNTWSSKPPECKVVNCPHPVLKNGRQISGFEEKFSYEARVGFECIEGFYMNGQETVVCGENSTWEPGIPVCLKGPKPTHPTKPPVYNYPGYPNPQRGLFDQELDPWIITLIVMTSIVGVIVMCLIIYRCLQHRKKGNVSTAT